MKFTWDPRKEAANLEKHGIAFADACQAFEDPLGWSHLTPSTSPRGERELRWWLLGKVGGRIMTVRYTHRPHGVIRIIGAGYWRDAARIYEHENQNR